MHAVVLHEGGRIDALDIGEAARVDALVWRGGGEVRKYTVLALCDSLPAAVGKAGEFRKEARKFRQDQQDKLDSGEQK